MKQRNSLAKNTILYMLGNFGSKILNFILVPLYTYYISTGDMGTYDIYYTTATLLMPLVSFSISEAAYRWLVDSKSEMNKVVGITLHIMLRGLAIFTVIYWIVVYIFKIDYSILFYLLVMFSGTYGCLLNIIRGLRKNGLYATLGVIQTFLILIFNIIFLVLLGQGVSGLLFSQVISYGILLVASSAIMGKIIQWKSFLKKDDPLMKGEMIAYAWPLIPNSINWWITNLSDRYMIRWIIGASANGIYSITCKFPGVFDTFIGFFSTAWQEDAICSYEEGINKEYFAKIFNKYFNFLVTSIVCAMPVTYYYIVFFMEKSYVDAWKFVPMLYMGSVFHALANYLSVGYNIKKETKWVTLTSLFAAIINILINLLFMEKYGIQVASLSTMVSYFTIFIVRYITTKDVFQMNINWFKFVGLCCYAGIMCSLVFLQYNIVNIVVFLVGGIVFLVMNQDFLKSFFKKINKKIKKQ